MEFTGDGTLFICQNTKELGQTNRPKVIEVTGDGMLTISDKRRQTN